MKKQKKLGLDKPEITDEKTEYEREYESENQIENATEIAITDQSFINPLPAITPVFEQNNPPRLQINNCKYNKNLINFTISVIFVIMLNIIFIPVVGTRYYSWMNEDCLNFYLYAYVCFVSVGLPTIYFVYHPRYFMNILKELKFLS